MNMFVTILLVAVASVSAQHQQQVDPAYLRQYYSQVAQQGQQHGPQRAATPIFEAQDQPQHYQQAAPKQNVSRQFLRGDEFRISTLS